MFVIEIKSGPKAPWKPLRSFGAQRNTFEQLSDALDCARGLDQDGYITADVRIRDTENGVVPRARYNEA